MKAPRNQRVLLLTAHRSGTSFWRVNNPFDLLRDRGVIDYCEMSIDQVPMRDRYWLERWDVVVFHQCWTDNSFILAQHFKSIGKKVVLSVDDLINGNKIPKFITQGAPYSEPGMAKNIQDMMDLADRVVVTQPFLLDQLAHYYEQPKSKFRVFPNLPPFNWLGRLYKPDSKAAKFKQRNGSLRIGVISSLSHYDMRQNVKPEDDIEIVVDAVKKLKEMGHNNITIVLPIGDRKEVKSRIEPFAKVETHEMVPIRDYPLAIDKYDLDLVVVPLVRNDFNDSKSNIKLIECASLGIPVLVSDSYAYQGFIDDKYKFKDAEELVQRIVEFKGWYEKKYRNEISANYKRFFESNTDYYGIELKGYWLENNFNLVGDTFLEWSQKPNEDGIVPPDIQMEKEDGQKTEG